MKNGRAVIFLGCVLISLILFSTLIAPTLSATHTETSVTTTTYSYTYTYDLNLPSTHTGSKSTPSMIMVSGTVSSPASYVTSHGSLPYCIESIIYSTEIVFGRPVTSIVSIIYRSGYYVPTSSMPASSVPWWMTGPYSSKETSTSVLSSAPESIEIVEKSSVQSASKA